MTTLLESLTEAVALLDDRGRILAGNSALSRLSGCGPQEWDAASLALLFPTPGNGDWVEAALARAREEGAAEAETRGTRRDGSELWLRLRLVSLAESTIGSPPDAPSVATVTAAGDSLAESAPPPPDGVRFLAIAEDITPDVERRFAQNLSRQLLEEACRREAALTHLNRELAALNQLAATVNHSLDLETILDAALEQALEVAEASTGWVFLLPPGNRDELELAAHRGLPTDYVARHHRSRVTECLPGKTVITGKPLVLYSLPADEEMTPPLRAQGVRCVAHIPLRSRDRTIGSLGIGSTGMHQLSEGLVRFLTAIGHQVGLAIENARLYEQVKQRADLDPLTGLYNRQRFCELLDDHLSELGARYWVSGAGAGAPAPGVPGQHPEPSIDVRLSPPEADAGPWVLMLDIDEFKQINDTYGHDQGDRVLKEVARFLRRAVRETDITARYGGDEFVVALCGNEASSPDEQARSARVVVERLRDRFAEADRRGEFSVPLAVSIGSACSGASSEVLLQLADAAMYREKRRRKRRSGHRHHGQEAERGARPLAGPPERVVTPEGGAPDAARTALVRFTPPAVEPA